MAERTPEAAWDEFYRAWGQVVDESHLYTEAAWRAGAAQLLAMNRLDRYLDDQAIPNPLIRPSND